MRLCSKCKIKKTLDYFCKDKSDKSGYNCYCKGCAKEQILKSKQGNPIKHKETARNYRKKNPDRIRNNKIKHRYGITSINYNQLFYEQGGCCKICGRHQSNLNKALSVDHNHETKNVRGLLCISCNSMIGLAKESVINLQNAIKYLESENT